MRLDRVSQLLSLTRRSLKALERLFWRLLLGEPLALPSKASQLCYPSVVAALITVASPLHILSGKSDCMMHAVTCSCRMRTKQKGKMTFTGTSNASSSGLQRTGSEISDSKFPTMSRDLCSLTVCLCICHLHCILPVTSCGDNAPVRSSPYLLVCIVAM